jgi:glycosyltransferase 2 family protein
MKLALKLVVTLILVAAIVWQLGNPRELWQLLVRINPTYVVLILAIFTLDRSLMTYKWGLLLRSRGQQLPFFRGLKIYCASMVWGIFLPMTVGADAIRAYSTARSGLATDEVVASILIERMVGFITALLLGLLSLFLLFLVGNLDEHLRPLWWPGSLVLLGAMVVFATSFSQTAYDFLHARLLWRLPAARIMRRLGQFHLAYLAYRHEKRSLTTFFGLTLVQQLTPIFLLWLTAQALDIEVSLIYMAGLVPLAFLISRIPVAISHVGVFEGVFMVLMSFAGLSAAESIAIALAARVLEMASWLPWWMAHVIGYGELRPPRIVPEGG